MMFANLVSFSYFEQQILNIAKRQFHEQRQNQGYQCNT